MFGFQDSFLTSIINKYCQSGRVPFHLVLGGILYFLEKWRSSVLEGITLKSLAEFWAQSHSCWYASMGIMDSMVSRFLSGSCILLEGLPEKWVSSGVSSVSILCPVSTREQLEFWRGFYAVCWSHKNSLPCCRSPSKTCFVHSSHDFLI